MGFTCTYKKDNYRYTIELSETEYQEIMDVRECIAHKKQELCKLLEMYERLEPSRVHRSPLNISIDNLLEL